MRAETLLSCAALGAAVACGDGGTATPDARPTYDARPIERSDRAYLFKTVRLPVDADDVDAAAFDYPGTTRPANKMGGLTTVLLDLMEGIPVQDNIDAGYADGTVMHLYVIHSGDPAEDDPQVRLTFYPVVEDGDDDPTNNFDGDAMIRIPDGAEAIDMGDGYQIVDGTLVGYGPEQLSTTWLLKYLAERDPYPTPGSYTTFRLQFDGAALTGHNGGVISPMTLETVTYPGIAEVLTYAIENDAPRADQIAGLYDANMDGVITAQEIATNDQMASLASPDVDMDGDGVPDHVSQGSGLELVRVTLVP